MLAKAGNTPGEQHFHKVQKFTYAQTLQELTVAGDGFHILLFANDTQPVQCSNALHILHRVRHDSPTTFLTPLYQEQDFN